MLCVTHRWRELDSNLYGAFPVKELFWFIVTSLFGAGKCLLRSLIAPQVAREIFLLEAVSSPWPVDRRAKDPSLALRQACPGSEQEGPARVAQCPHKRRSGARGRLPVCPPGQAGVHSAAVFE
jgi:hypothetical protein